MERTQILDLMSSLKLYGMRSAYDEVMASGITRQHEPPRIVGDLLQSEIAEKQARSIKYQMTIAKLPLAKDLDDCDVTGTPVHRYTDPCGLGSRACKRHLRRRSAQRGAGWWHRDRKIAPGASRVRFEPCPGATKAFRQSCGRNRSQMAPTFFHRASQDPGAAFRIRGFRLENAISIGFRSGG